MKELKKIKMKMDLLNSDEMKKMQGGYSCSGTGDTVMCVPIVGKIVMCATAEGSCSPSFSSSCTTAGVTINCPTFTVSR